MPYTFPMSPPLKSPVRLLVSAALVVHLLGVVTSPNRVSFLTQTLAPVFYPYLSVLGLYSTWSFFAPEPFYAPVHIDYKIERRGGMPLEGRFPPAENPYFFRDRYNRRISLTRQIIGTEGNIKGMLMSWLCHQHPDLDSAQLWGVMATIPSLEQVKLGDRKITDPAELRTEVLGTHYCPEGSQPTSSPEDPK